MRAIGPNDQEEARALDALVTDPTARSVFDFLIDSAGERYDGATIADRLGLAEHKDVGRATYHIGERCADLGISRPWNEAQQGYCMAPEIGELFRQVRTSSSSFRGDRGISPSS